MQLDGEVVQGVVVHDMHLVARLLELRGVAEDDGVVARDVLVVTQVKRVAVVQSVEQREVLVDLHREQDLTSS